MAGSAGAAGAGRGAGMPAAGARPVRAPGPRRRTVPPRFVLGALGVAAAALSASGLAQEVQRSSAGVPAPASAYASAEPTPRATLPSGEGILGDRDGGATAPSALSPAAPAGPAVPDPARPPAPQAALDAAALRQALDAYRRGAVADGDRLRDTFADAALRSYLDWSAIRLGAPVGLERIVALLRADPTWPTGALVRRRAEEAVLLERKGPAFVRAFFAAQRPISASGKFALALAFKSDGQGQGQDQGGTDADAAALVRDLWREDACGREFEAKVLDAFPGVLGEVDHRFRMERLLFKENWEAAGRAAGYAGAASGKAYATLVRARRAVDERGPGAAAALEAVPPSLRGDSSYLFSRAQFLRRAEKHAEAAKVIALAPVNPEVIADGDEWWVERRIVARKLLDTGDPRGAYALAAMAAPRSAEKRIEAAFHAAWIALRFLAEPETAARHLDAAAATAETPISLGRVAYWQGRAAEALGRGEVAHAAYARAAAQPVTYYGQLARAKLGTATLALRPATELDPAARAAFLDRPALRALRLLDAAGLRDLALPLYVDAAARLASAPELGALGDLALEGRDARALVAVGKAAVQRGFPLDVHAYPTIGIPAYEASSAVLPVERAMVYAIARQESQFDPKARSGVGASGLMQLMPATARRTAARVGLGFDEDRLTADPAYNAKIGTAHLGELMADWRGSYILVFASYNAGGGNVKKWIDAYGDPRRADVDPIDWIERIPFSETRNYVQRVMENLQVYRGRLEGAAALLIEGDLRRGAARAGGAEAGASGPGATPPPDAGPAGTAPSEPSAAAPVARAPSPGAAVAAAEP